MIKIEIMRETRNDGSEKVSGYAMYLDTKFTFNLYAASREKEYPFALKASVIDPSSGKILQSTKKMKALKNDFSEAQREKVRKGHNIECLNAQATAYLRDASDKSIKSAVDKLVIKLFAQYEDDIRRGLQVTPDKGDLTMSTLCRLHREAFLRTEQKTTKKVLEEKQRNLKKVCDYLSGKSAKALTVDDVRKVSSKIGKNPMKTIRLLGRFMNFCADNHFYCGQNIADDYVDAEKKRKPTGNGQYRRNVTHLTDKVEGKLHKEMVSNMDDAAMAIALVKGFSASVDQMLTLTWGDLIINGNDIRIPDFQASLTGGTRNYIRPPTKETKELLLMRFDLLRQEYTDRQLKKLHVVNLAGSMTAKKAWLSKSFQKMLSQAGVSKADMTAAGSADPKKAGGAGYTLLHRHYDYVLRNRLGVDPESGVGCYLRGVRIPDVTGDYYRSLSDVTGDHFLQVIMRRDDGFIELSTQSGKIASRTDNGKQTITIPCGTPSTRTAVTTRKRIFLPAGTAIAIGALDGVEGQVVFYESATAEPTDWQNLI